MELEKQIEELKGKKIKELQAFAKQGKIQEITMCANELERLDKLLKRHKENIEALEALQACSNIKTTKSSLNISHKQKGKIRREEFVNLLKQKGININNKHGVLYKMESGKLVGIAYASERANNKWFLGLPEQKYDAFVLICEDEYGKKINFIFSKEFYQNHKNDFSKDKKNQQLKFNISKFNEHYKMKLPEMEEFDISEYVDNFKNLLA